MEDKEFMEELDRLSIEFGQCCKTLFGSVTIYREFIIMANTWQFTVYTWILSKKVRLDASIETELVGDEWAVQILMHELVFQIMDNIESFYLKGPVDSFLYLGQKEIKL